MNTGSTQIEVPCFFELVPTVSLLRRGFVEGLGTLLLTLAATGAFASPAQSEAPHALVLVSGALAAAGALVALIVAFGPVSGGHFNPLITMLQWLSGERSRQCTAVYCLSQILGALLGACVTASLFPMRSPATAATSTAGILLSEFTCSAALMIVVFACSRSGNRTIAPFAVGAWLAGAIIATPSSSIANPAIALAGVLLHGLSEAQVVRTALISCVEVAGALLALAIVSVAYPRGHISNPNNASTTGD